VNVAAVPEADNPADAPLATVERWQQVFARTSPSNWPDGVDRSGALLDILRLLAKGPEVAREAGDKLLPKLSHRLWVRACESACRLTPNRL